MSEAPLVDPVRLTRFSHGAGCGCKISPGVLGTILHEASPPPHDPRLLVGYDTRDDAAVYDLGDGRALIATVDFFSPIVDDPFDFGRVAATNALSDVYAMGGTPRFALAVLGWPVDRIPPELAAQVMQGARQVCREAGVSLAGGHSIDAPEPFFGLSVTGDAPLSHIKRNDTARAGDILLLTKPLGTGILATALKRDQLRPEDVHIALDSMCARNEVGTFLGGMKPVHAMTDVTGFGLLGHLLEMCEGSGLQTKIAFASIPKLPEVDRYLALGCYPDGTFRNWKSQAARVTGADGIERMMLLSDPQTSGGLLLAVEEASAHHVMAAIQQQGAHVWRIGQLLPSQPGNRVVHVE
ncbi:MAG: selenide, water dikinase SelD [Flavobacteriales bacterium]|nr:selenide, water dikinase SelD [Flavobacteriales bacterium]